VPKLAKTRVPESGGIIDLSAVTVPGRSLIIRDDPTNN
jgi:hypothetical protein